MYWRETRQTSPIPVTLHRNRSESEPARRPPAAGVITGRLPPACCLGPRDALPLGGRVSRAERAGQHTCPGRGGHTWGVITPASVRWGRGAFLSRGSPGSEPGQATRCSPDAPMPALAGPQQALRAGGTSGWVRSGGRRDLSFLSVLHGSYLRGGRGSWESPGHTPTTLGPACVGPTATSSPWGRCQLY